MPNIPGSGKYRATLSKLNKAMNAAYQLAADGIKPVILAAANEDGEIDDAQARDVRRQAGELVQGIFVGDDGYSSFDENWQPLAEIPLILNEYYLAVTYAAVEAQRSWLEKNIPEDIYEWLATRPIDFEALGESAKQRTIREDEDFDAMVQRRRIFRPNPLAEYDAMHTWVDENGYRLSDRIWQGSQSTRRKLDQMIADHIAQGTGSLQLSELVEQFLLPSRKNFRTRKPYGINASYDGMRLARSEIAQAANRAALIAAMQNPYVDRVDVRRSPNGDPTCKICPMHATIGINGERLRDPYVLGAGMMPIYHPHCKCHIQPINSANPAQVTADLRAIIQDARAQLLDPVLTPAQGDNFVQALMYKSLGQVISQFTGQLPLPLFL